MSQTITHNGKMYVAAEVLKEIHYAAVQAAMREVELLPDSTKEERKRRWNRWQRAYDDYFVGAWRGLYEESGLAGSVAGGEGALF